MSPDVDFKENEDMCESGGAGDLYWVIILKLQRHLTGT